MYLRLYVVGIQEWIAAQIETTELVKLVKFGVWLSV